MRILVVTPWFPTTDTPVSGVFVRREAEALALRHDVTVLHLDWQGGRTDNGEAPYRSVHIPLRRNRPLDYRRARRLVAEEARTHDVVHTHALTGLLPWPDRRPGGAVPWVHSEHWSGISAPHTLRSGERLALAVLGRRLRAADAAIAESSRLAAAMQRYRTRSIDIVPCVVEPPNALSERPADGVLRLLGIGGLIPRKGPLLAVRALAELRDRGVAATLTWVGAGVLHDEILRESAALGVADRLRLTGSLDDEGVARELDESTLFLLPTQGDNFCVVAAEALVHGRPIVSGAATGAVDYAAPSVSRFVAEQQPAAYADAVVDLASATAALRAADVAATVANRFTPDTVVERLTEIYERVVAAHGVEA